VAAWRANLAVITPIGSDPQSPVRVSGEDDAERHEPPKEDVLEGIERMPEAFLRLLHGKNFGKQIVRITKAGTTSSVAVPRGVFPGNIR
jgi:hypothetical protein